MSFRIERRLCLGEQVFITIKHTEQIYAVETIEGKI